MSVVPENKRAVLAVSFGTSHAETRKKTIDVIERELREECPDLPFYRAWTSTVILRKLRERGMESADTIAEAMERMARDGIREVAVQPTHVMDGIENERMRAKVLDYRDRFSRIVFGAPLLADAQDCRDTVEAVMAECGSLRPGEALVLMGHGTIHPANGVYKALECLFHDREYRDVYVGTVEGSPRFADVLEQIGRGGYERVRLAPLMVVAGEHALKDMAGPGEDSWKNRLLAEGLEVRCHLKGLGEYAGVRRIFREHLKKAVQEADRGEAKETFTL